MSYIFESQLRFTFKE